MWGLRGARGQRGNLRGLSMAKGVCGEGGSRGRAPLVCSLGVRV